jgi:hypothetical protein
MLTLTLRASDAPLSEVVDRLLASFRALRRTPLWKSSVRASVATIETTRGRDGSHWHVHLHVLWCGGFLPQPKVKAEWHRITGDSFVVSVNAMQNARLAAHYVAKYVAKSADVASWKPAVLREYALAMKGRRLLITSGDWHGSAIGTRPVDTASGGCQTVITLGELITGHRVGVPECTECLLLLSHCGWIGKQLTPIQLATPPPDGPAALESLRTAMLAAACDARDALRRRDEREQLDAVARSGPASR